ncbi:VanZ family protein [Clostridium intestinale]|uniref:VanZ family protein n=1 Tax=Clostridium intestinale TaxID=36845 RepID=UPI002DD6541C|nr:VanZ family protein [Clostridium intestinale]WRY49533.1 VanZ family protein [Clostridium intestinale]
MERVDKYINSIYRNLKVDSSELNDLKSEMRSHLVEAIKELKEEGYSEDESITIALEKFGDKFHLEGELTQVFNIKKDNTITLILLSLIYIPIAYSIAYFTGPGTFSGISLLIILIPVYSIYTILLIIIKLKKHIVINKLYEFTKFCFIVYLVILFGKLLFPVEMYPDLSKSSFPDICAPLSYKITTIIREILYFIPLGALTPIVSKRFKSLKKVIFLTVLFLVIKSIFVVIISLLGMGVYRAIFIDLLIINIIGSLLGYCIYSISKKHMKLNF